MDAGLTDQAIDELLRALEKDPTNGDIYFRLGLLYFEKEEYRIAIGYFQKVVNQFPEQAILDASYYYLGLCHYQLREYKTAARNFSLLLSGFPESPFGEQAYFYQGEAVLSYMRLLWLKPLPQ